jgi:UbiD family decarboxylase
MEFRHFLKTLQSESEIKVVSDPIGCGEIPGRVIAEESGENRAVMFENISGCRGNVVGNLFGSQERINQSMVVADAPSLYDKIDRAIATPQLIKVISPDEQEYDISPNPSLLHQLPPIIHSRHDSTPYITSGVVLARNPDSGKHHLCFVRLSVQDSNVVLFNAQTPRIKEIVAKTVGRGLPLDVVILIGAPTEVMLLGTLSFTDDVDELQVAQALGGESLRFLERDLPVPLPTEMILFGRVLPEYRPEGPFGELTGMYSTHSNPICVIDALWERKGFIYHSILGGVSREHVALVSLKARHALERLKNQTPHILDYCLPGFAAGKLCLLIVADGIVKDDIVRDLFDVPLVKLFVLLNEDTDLQCSDDVLWALTQRTGESGDIVSKDENPVKGLARKTIIDATVDDLSDWDNVRVEVYE